jgi:hypothetical protein
VSGYRYTLDEQNRVAHRMAIPQRATAAFPPAPTPAEKSSLQGNTTRPPVPVQLLASPEMVIEGVIAEGKRTTFTTPAGQEGNDRPISTISDVWTSPELHERLEYISSDPRRGEMIEQLTNIDRNNPDPSLFQIPADYEIVDEQAPFSINYHR